MKLVFIGASNPETIRMIRALKEHGTNFEPIGFIDNDKLKHGKEFFDLPILGGSEKIPELAQAGCKFINLITGSTVTRYEVTIDAFRKGAQFANFIHPSVNQHMTKFGLGNYIQEGVVTQACVEVGDNSSIHMGSLIGHETKVGNSVFIAHAVSVSGCCLIEDGCFIGTNATILPRIKIGKWSIVGAGSVVIKDVPPYSIVVGNPAKIIKKNEINYQDGRVFV